MITKRKPTRKQTDAEMGALMRRLFGKFIGPFRGYQRAIEGQWLTVMVAGKPDLKAMLKQIARLANRMAMEDKEKRR